MIISRINKINEELAKKKDGLPPLSISVGIAHGKGIEEPAKLFEQADQSLYEAKNRGKHGYSFYTKR
ncbi:MAG: diguanylate cyclase, partial [Clostridia bacterium]|nr:diguanylate cyclase [Clostridia bacterium]